MKERMVGVVYGDRHDEVMELLVEMKSINRPPKDLPQVMFVKGVMPGNAPYYYRVPGEREFKLGDVVEVPPTSKDDFKGDNILVTIVELESRYNGPTHPVLKKHRHKYNLCRCGKEHV